MELAQTRQLLTSLSMVDIECRFRDSNTEVNKNKNKNKERVIKISIQKDGLSREVGQLKKRVVALSDEVSRLAHEREVLQAEINRVT
jgi:predicted  nucleic acid-binding Zn-ribbon protein